MYIVTKAYNDYSADLFNTKKFKVEHFTEEEVFRLVQSEKVLGVEEYCGVIESYLQFDVNIFQSMEEAEEYMSENNIRFSNYETSIGSVVVYKETSRPLCEVPYVIFYRHGDEIKYLARSKGYTSYLANALKISKSEAVKKVFFMNKNGKTGSYWKTEPLTN